MATNVTYMSQAVRGSKLSTESDARVIPRPIADSSAEASVDTSGSSSASVLLVVDQVSQYGVSYEITLETQAFAGSPWTPVPGGTFYGSAPPGGVRDERIVNGLGIATRARWTIGASPGSSGRFALTGSIK